MVNTKGYRRGTRYLFAKGFRKHGVEPLSTFLRIYHRGDSVRIKGNGAFPQGMPHKYYHGKTGKIFNITRRGVGVIVNKRVRHRIIAKKISIGLPHIKLMKKAPREIIESEKKPEKEGTKAKKRHCYRNRRPKLDYARVVCTKNNKPIYVEPLPYEYLV